MALSIKKWLFCCLTILSLPVLSHANDMAEVEISSGHIRETIPGTTISAAYLSIKNNTKQTLKLTSVTSKVSPRLELHEHLMADGLMQMRQIPHIIIPADSEVTLKPSGLHIMIFELSKGLKAGEQVPVSLVFENKSVVNITLPVQSIKQHHH